MPSPIVHSIVGYVVYSLTGSSENSSKSGEESYYSLLESVIFSTLPDIDAFFGLLLRDMRGLHNNISHSVFFGLFISLVSAGLVRRPSSSSAYYYQRVRKTFALYLLHLLTDLLGYNKRGLMLFAPFSTRRYRVPITIFYGFRWGRGPFSSSHLWTLATELIVTLFVLHALKIFRKVRNVK